jgi:hypothetical protein
MVSRFSSKNSNVAWGPGGMAATSLPVTGPSAIDAAKVNGNNSA